MPLGDLSALDNWERRDQPTAVVRAAVRRWVNALVDDDGNDHSFLYPSTIFPELSFQPNYEVRSAVIPDSGGVEVFYRHEYATGLIALIWVLSPRPRDR